MEPRRSGLLLALYILEARDSFSEKPFQTKSYSRSEENPCGTGLYVSTPQERARRAVASPQQPFQLQVPPKTVVLPVRAIEVHTPKEVEAANGTDARLKCTFTTTAAVSAMLTVTWTFRVEPEDVSQQVFYYHEQPYAFPGGPFKGRAVWDGNVNKKDVSIVIRDIDFSDRGIYSCHVKNPPDVSGLVGEIQLQVVNKVSWSEMYILAIAIGGASFLIIVVVLVVVLLRYRKKNRKRSTELSMGESSKEKDAVREKMMESSDTGV